jgi:hypothetical protein
MMSNRLPRAIGRVTLAALLVCLAACQPPRPLTQSVEYYKAHPGEMNAILKNCGDWFGLWPTDEQPCQNAEFAQYSIQHPEAPLMHPCRYEGNSHVCK